MVYLFQCWKHKDWVRSRLLLIENPLHGWVQSVFYNLLCFLLLCKINLSWVMKLEKQVGHQLWMAIVWLFKSDLLSALKSQFSHSNFFKLVSWDGLLNVLFIVSSSLSFPNSSNLSLSPSWSTSSPWTVSSSWHCSLLIERNYLSH